MSKSVSYKLPQIIARDGGEWVCHYCGCKLIPPGIEWGTPPYYDLVISKVGYCAYWRGHFRGVRDSQAAKKYRDWLNGNLVFWDTYYKMSPEYRSPHVDHVIPSCLGGSNALSNLVAACSKCNTRKGAKSYLEFVAEVAS